MSQVKLQAAREFIREQDYEAARAILLTMPGNDKADEWLERIEQIAPKRQRHTTRVVIDQTSSRVNWLVIGIVAALVIVVGVAVFALYQEQTASSTASREYACGLTRPRYSTEWQNCVNDR